MKNTYSSKPRLKKATKKKKKKKKELLTMKKKERKQKQYSDLFFSEKEGSNLDACHAS